MSHWPILPIVVPLLAAILCLIVHRAGPAVASRISLASVLALGVCAIVLLARTGDDSIDVYRLGNWPAPYGIVLVVDRLAAMMVSVVAALALPVLLAAIPGTAAQGRHFHPLFQLQLAGLNGAFLTGDIFNLFVFFEILLLASYALLIHGGGAERARAGLAYTALNLAGSALFLIALGLLYGTLGTLNLADIALALAAVDESDRSLVRAACALLVAVFLLKSALLPLSFWLPHVYAAPTAPVAALFAIMTKVGVYALLRVTGMGFSAVPFTADLLQSWLPVLAVLTIAFGTVGALAATRLAILTANLVVISTGTLLAAVAAASPEATAAALYYLPHTTLATAALFLLGDAIARERGAKGDGLVRGRPASSKAILGGAYVVLALAISGIPPLSGFIGKVMLMQSLRTDPSGTAVWIALLVSGFAVALALARAASVLFWERSGGEDAPRTPLPLRGVVPLALLALASPMLTVTAGPVSSYARAAAEQLHDRGAYITAVLGPKPTIQRERRP